jgi:hypothetical protein
MRWEAALCGALVFALSEYVLVKVGTGGVNQLWALAWVPWVLRAIERAALGEKGAVAALGLWAGFGLLAGHVQVWMFMGPAMAVYSVAIVVREKDGMQRFGRIVAGAALALGVSAVQWLPTAELLALTGDRPDVDPAELHAWSAPAAVLAGKVLPGIFGARPGSYWGGEEFEHELAGLAGLAVLLLVVLGVRRRDPRRVTFAWFAAAGLVLALGYRNDVTGWLNSLPVIGWSRVPGRAQSLTVLGGSILAAHGVADLLDGSLSPRAALVRAGVGLGAAVACVAVVVSTADGGGAWRATLPHAARAGLLGAAVVAAGAYAALRRPAMARAVPVALLCALLLSAPAVHAVSTDFLDVRWSERLPQKARGHRVHLADFRLPYVEREGIRTYRRPAHVEPATTRRVYEAISPGIVSWMDIGATLIRPELPRGPPAALDRIVRIEGVPVPPRGPGRLHVAAETVKDDATALRRLTTGEDVLLLAAGATTPEPEAGPAGSVTLAANAPLHVAFDTDAPGRRWLFASEKWYPGWEATIDGAPVPTHRANVGFRAVDVPAGRHRVAFRYRPWTLLAGALVSLVALALCAVGRLRAREPESFTRSARKSV